MNLKSLAALTLAASAAPLASAGLLTALAAYGTCQTGCNAVAVACYTAAGVTFGVTVVGGPPAVLVCNAALGTCMTACAAITILAPTP
ncbi:hypothetical protein V8E55_009073 [Tylopilus felleus]